MRRTTDTTLRLTRLAYLKEKICRQLLTVEDSCGLEYEFHVAGTFGYPAMLKFEAAPSNHVILLIKTISLSHGISKCSPFIFKR